MTTTVTQPTEPAVLIRAVLNSSFRESGVDLSDRFTLRDYNRFHPLSDMRQGLRAGAAGCQRAGQACQQQERHSQAGDTGGGQANQAGAGQFQVGDR